MASGPVSDARSSGSGGGRTTLETRSWWSGSRPMWKSAPKGQAISRANNSPNDLPVILLVTSPTRWPWLRLWQPETVPRDRSEYIQFTALDQRQGAQAGHGLGC